VTNHKQLACEQQRQTCFNVGHDNKLASVQFTSVPQALICLHLETADSMPYYKCPIYCPLERECLLTFESPVVNDMYYMYRTAVTICTAQWSLYVPHSGHYMYRTAVTIYTAQRSLYIPHSGHYMYRTAVTICTVPPV